MPLDVVNTETFIARYERSGFGEANHHLALSIASANSCTFQRHLSPKGAPRETLTRASILIPRAGNPHV